MRLGWCGELNLLRLLSIVAVLVASALAIYAMRQEPELEKPYISQTGEPDAINDEASQGSGAADSGANTEKPNIGNVGLLFRPVDDEVVDRLSIALDNKFSAGIKPMGYVRHRFANIDVPELQNELRKSFEAFDETQSESPITIQLFDDLSFDVVVTRWHEGHQGRQAATGRILINNPTDWSTSFSFDGDGTVRGTIRTPTHWYRIERASELPYHVVYQSEYTGADM
jgi:hypothetical protein